MSRVEIDFSDLNEGCLFPYKELLCVSCKLFPSCMDKDRMNLKKATYVNGKDEEKDVCSSFIRDTEEDEKVNEECMKCLYLHNCGRERKGRCEEYEDEEMKKVRERREFRELCQKDCDDYYKGDCAICPNNDGWRECELAEHVKYVKEHPDRPRISTLIRGGIFQKEYFDEEQRKLYENE